MGVDHPFKEVFGTNCNGSFLAITKVASNVLLTFGTFVGAAAVAKKRNFGSFCISPLSPNVLFPHMTAF